MFGIIISSVALLSTLSPSYVPPADPPQTPQSLVSDLEVEVEEPPSIYTSCIKTARWLGVSIPYGTDAEDLTHNTTLREAEAVLLKYGDVYHVAVITKLGENGIHIAEGNYKPGAFTMRVIKFDDPNIRGFYKAE